MVLKLRRYRVFLIFAAIATIAFIQFVRMRDWSPSSVLPLQNINEQSRPKGPANDAVTPHKFAPEDDPKPAAVIPHEDKKGSSGSSSSSKGSDTDSSSQPAKANSDKSNDKEEPVKHPYSSATDNLSSEGQGKHEDTNKLGVHWEKQPEHFPVADEDVIKLPTSQTKEIPKIQYNFLPETDSIKKITDRRLAAVRESFLNSWTGYKETALGHDEILPVTGGYRDPFSGWGATLVDSLDTLWMMGMKEEFEDAVKEVQKIDFTTSTRKDIPVFETVIRYLGGLLAAYDISDGHYVILLDKAIELADILMGAFDTPNRMPMTYYYWPPAYASQPHRAGTRTVLAELGSLSMEFTRLAQLTQKDRYYDAIARITNALEKWQKHSNLPGLWPTHVDASGCKKPEDTLTKIIDPAKGRDSTTSKSQEKGGAKANIHDKREESQSKDSKVDENKDTIDTRAKPPSKGNSAASKAEKPIDPSLQDCEKQGLNSPPSSATDKFTLGALADSAYEYLPKEYMLLGGVNDQYRKMYEQAMDTVRKYLLYRPMIDDNDRNILFASSATSSEAPSSIKDLEYKYEGSHLGCFAGGMFGIGAKIFGIKGDLKIAAKLTDSCVWAYESTETGIMPESFELFPCESMEKCTWDEELYRKNLDPYEESRKEEAESRVTREEKLEKARERIETNKAKFDSDSPESKYSPRLPVHKDSAAAKSQYPPKIPINQDTSHAKREPAKYRPSYSGSSSGKVDVLSHDDFVNARIREDRIPPGFTDITSRKYILRPEAIESVFIMYRISGDEYWRERGWDMFQAIEKHTRTPLGNSAINDVTSEAPLFLNQMESFWLGETLKYFYLLFSDPDVVSLDEFVLNTEAHAFKRPE